MPSHSPPLALNHCWDNEGNPPTPPPPPSFCPSSPCLLRCPPPSILQVILATVTASDEAPQDSLGYLDPQEPTEPPASLDERVSLVTPVHRASAVFRDLL